MPALLVPECEPPKIGVVYSVPCVDDLPVFGPIHSDPEINDLGDHLHIDDRFLTDQQIAETYQTGIRVAVWAIFQHRDKLASRITWQEMECKRSFIKKKFTQAHMSVVRAVVGGAVLPACLKCPHRGFDLRGVRPTATGVVICPGHGLRWNLTTGEQV